MQERLPSGSMANRNRIADGRLKALPKGVNQHAQPCVIAVRHGTTMASQQCLVLNALAYADPSIARNCNTVMGRIEHAISPKT